MPMVPFFTKCPKTAEAEFRTFKIMSDIEIPASEYGLIELYCDEPNCDCRRVFVQILAANSGGAPPLATINFGWEDASFYQNWTHITDEPDYIAHLMGPSLALTSQSPLAPRFLEVFKEMAEDPDFVDMLRRHYALFRESVDAEAGNSGRKRGDPGTRVGPNKPCPCGSGKKFKKCCGRSQ